MNMLFTGYGIFESSSLAWIIPVAAAGAVTLGFFGAPLWVWMLVTAALLFGMGGSTWAWGLFVLVGLLFNIRSFRRHLITRPIMYVMRSLGFLPSISDTERTAIEAGTVWVDGELFSGKPNLERLHSEAYPDLTKREAAFLDGPVEEVCRMTNDWEVYQKRDLPPEVWAYLKREGFFGMIIPEQYGGLGFSASANSAVVAKLASRSVTLAVTVMVPNSLGPAELLYHYGTEEQKSYYLPRLAR